MRIIYLATTYVVSVSEKIIEIVSEVSEFIDWKETKKNLSSHNLNTEI